MTEFVDYLNSDGEKIGYSFTISDGTNQSTTLYDLEFNETGVQFTDTATSITTANSAYVAGATIGSTAKGQRTNIPLPPLSVPVPNLASPAATAAAYPSETDKKNTGLYVPSGALIYVGVDQAIAAPSANTRVHIFAQGGFF